MKKNPAAPHAHCNVIAGADSEANNEVFTFTAVALVLAVNLSFVFAFIF